MPLWHMVITSRCYWIGSSVPSTLSVMREQQPPVAVNIQEQSRPIAFIHSESVGMHNPYNWATATNLENEVCIVIFDSIANQSWPPRILFQLLQFFLVRKDCTIDQFLTTVYEDL